MGRHPIQVRALGFKSGAAMGAVQSGPNGPPTNDYWRSRTKEASWELREKLLNGDTRGVCEMLNLPCPQESEPFDIWASLKGWLQPRESKGRVATLVDFDVDAYVWADDGGHSALHYLAIGRRRSNYAGWKTRYPLFGDHAFPGPEANESKKQRAALLQILMDSNKIGVTAVARKNEAGATPLHFLAVTDDDTILNVLQPFLVAETLAVTDSAAVAATNPAPWWQGRQEPPSGLSPADLALRFGNIRAATLLGLENLAGLPAAKGLMSALSAADLDSAVVLFKEEQVAVDTVSQLDTSGKLLKNDEERLSVIAAKEAALAEKLCISRKLAASLLIRSNFDLRRAVELFTTEYNSPEHSEASADGVAGTEATRKSVASASTEPSQAHDVKTALTCPVCYDTVLPEERGASVAVTAMACGHFVCDACLGIHARVRICDEASLAMLVCPAHGCKEPITSAAIYALFPARPAGPPSREETSSDAVASALEHWSSQLGDLVGPSREGYVRDKYDRMLSNAYVDASPTAAWCPAAACESCVVQPDAALTRSLSVGVTCGCGFRFCFACKEVGWRGVGFRV